MSSKKLYRSRENVIVAGVMSGFAEYFHHDPTWWRLGFAAFLIATGFMPGVLIYIVAWILMPLRPTASFDYEQ
jgi:phage shock protein C